MDFLVHPVFYFLFDILGSSHLTLTTSTMAARLHHVSCYIACLITHHRDNGERCLRRGALEPERCASSRIAHEGSNGYCIDGIKNCFFYSYKSRHGNKTSCFPLRSPPLPHLALGRLRVDHVETSLDGQAEEAEEANVLAGANVPSGAVLLVDVGVADGVEDAGEGPPGAEGGGGDGVLEAGGEEEVEEAGVALEEVSVAALGAVEEVEGVLFVLGLGGGGLLGAGVQVRVGDAGALAEGADAGAVPESDEDGEGAAEDDVAEAGERWRD